MNNSPIYISSSLASRHNRPGLHAALKDDPFFVCSDTPTKPGGLFARWGICKDYTQGESLYLEKGFWRDSVVMDRRGLYWNSSYNTSPGWAEVARYQAPRPAFEILVHDMEDAKYDQGPECVPWSGVVLPLQVPRDAQVLSGDECNEARYQAFVEDACQYYGKDLLLKAHPLIDDFGYLWARNIARHFGCRYARCGMESIEKCSFVLLWNSGFAVDAMLRGVRVAQFAPGWFHNTPAVTYTDGAYPANVPDTTDAGRKLVDFLVWRAVFSEDLPHEDWMWLLKKCAAGTDMFPLPEQLSYGYHNTCGVGMDKDIIKEVSYAYSLYSGPQCGLQCNRGPA